MSVAYDLDVAPRSAVRPQAIDLAIDQACGRIAPLWPLKHFVAVNPFLGFVAEPFEAACVQLRRLARTEMLPPRNLYAAALAEGRIEDEDLAAAIAAAPATVHGRWTPFSLRSAAGDVRLPPLRDETVATVADVLDHLAAGDRHVARTAFMIDEISRWCAAYFDEGQSAWRSPWREETPYAAWRGAMRHDRTPEAMGIRGFRAAVASCPAEARQAIDHVVRALGIPADATADYLHRALIDVGGWAAYARYRLWDNALYGRADETLVELLAIRVVWGYALFLERTDEAFAAAWRAAMAAACGPRPDRPESLEADLLLQGAYEHAYQRRLLATLRSPVKPVAAPARPQVQAAFCIDVRSEVYRRALETTATNIATKGFAGFFGFPIEYVPIGRVTGGAHCPVLLKPAFTVCEAVQGAGRGQEGLVLERRLLRRRVAKAWKAFKLSAVSSFTYVEAAGLLFLGKLVGDGAGFTRPVADPNNDGLDPDVAAHLGPRLEPRLVDGRATGFNAAQRLAMAEAVLRAMSLTDGFARLVLLAGHGSTTVNNPHASGLDCGACGGHTGEANARVAAAILNDGDVRSGLSLRGIVIPSDTWFVAGLHDTTTDEIALFDTLRVPGSHTADLQALRESLARASALARSERAAGLNLVGTADPERAIPARSRDWSQVRPEWGLAGCAAFIAAPRERTRGRDLGGRAFLHDYDWRQDKDFSTLKLIMTAPMVVASWISLQYYGSTVNNRVFGSGDKTLHNVVGQLGVLEGNAGDLRVGLPLQSVHDGRRFVHEPIRLSVLIEAPTAAIDDVIAADTGVRDLVENGWLHLFAFADEGRAVLRRQAGAWETAA